MDTPLYSYSGDIFFLVAAEPNTVLCYAGIVLAEFLTISAIP
jgi:hypothetical protein